MADLQLRGINKSFGVVPVITDVDLDIGDGEFVVFVGPSGCGKSTLLRTISGLEEPSSGQVLHRRRGCHRLRSVANAASRWCSSPMRSIRT